MPEQQVASGSLAINLTGNGPPNNDLSAEVILIDVVTPDGRFTVYPHNDGPTTPNTGTDVEVHIRYRNIGSRAKFCFALQTVSDEPGHPPGPWIFTPWDWVDPGIESVHVHYLRFGGYGAQVNTRLLAEDGVQANVFDHSFRIDTRPVDGDDEPTHYLKIDFIRLPWFDSVSLAQTIGTIADACNPLIEPLGYHFKHVEIDLEKDVLKVYYRKTGSPAWPLLAIIAALALLAGILGFFAWKISEVLVPDKVQLETIMKEIDFLEYITQLRAEGKISEQEFQDLLQAFRDRTQAGKFPLEIVILGAAGLLIFSEVYKKKKKGRKK